MWYDATGNQEADRVRRNLTSPLMGAPGHPLYRKDWGIPLPHSFYNDDLSEKPVAHRAELASAPFFYGQMPHANVAAWERFQNYYFNCVIDVDRQLAMLLNGLEAAGEADNTVIIYTSDHGERAGAHGMRQKGSTIYDEDLRVPFYVVHPGVQGGHTTKKLASAVDIAPMLLTAAGVTAAQQAERWPDLKGVDITPALGRNGSSTARDERGILFSYAVGYGWTGGDVAPGVEMARPLPAPDKSLRRLHRGVFDGRYKFARYFAPNDHHTPTDWATLSAKNDLEMYDMQADPHELRNLAIPGRASQEQLMRLNAMTNALVETEVGPDDGREYTGIYALNGNAAAPAAATPAPAPAATPAQGG
jgi:arylsulfatase